MRAETLTNAVMSRWKSLSRRSPATAGQRRSDWFFGLILAAVTILAYQPAWHGGLLWDDDANVATPELRSLDGFGGCWVPPRATQEYQPLHYSSSWLQQRLLGDSPTGYHLVNLLLHIGCVVLVLKILRFLRVPG